MPDRQRLLIYSILILAIVAAAGVGITGLQFQLAAPVHFHPSPDEATARYATAVWLAVAQTLVVVVAGGTLLLRVIHPFTSRLEQSESRIRTILNTAGDGILTINAAGQIESMNFAAQRMFGVDGSAAEGRHFNTLIKSTLSQVLAIADLTSAHEYRGVKTSGECFPLELSASAIAGQQPAWTCIVRDVTERKAVEQQMREQMAMLQQAREHLEAKAAELARINRELDDFTYVASHDLKEPLRGISSYCEILLEDYNDRLDEAGQRRLSTLVELCQRLSRLIDDLLAYSRIGRTPADFRDIDLHAIAEDAIATLSPAIEQRSGRVIISSALPTLCADPTLVGEVLRNLIVNGLKFNDSAEPTVEIGAIPGFATTLYVRDNGIGIPEQHHSAIFTMFRRLHSRKKYDGTGAGLTFVRKIVEAHGGRVWLESAPGVGSTFYFTLTPGEGSVLPEFAASAAD